MTITLTAALFLTIAGFLVLLDRKDKRERDERATLLQRIQAPEAATYEHAVQHAPPDEPYPLSDDEAQKELEVAQALERMEQMEAEAAPWLS